MALAAALLVGVVLGSAPRAARAAEVQIESPAFTFDAEANLYRYEGARVIVEGLRVEADEVVIEGDTGRLTAQGRVRFQDGPVIGAADRLELQADSDLVTAYNAEVLDTDSGYHLRADKLVREAVGRYVASDCQLTNCDPQHPAWTVNASRIDYRLDDFATAQSATLRLGGVPVLWSPVFAWPTVEQRRSGFLAPSIADNSRSKDRFATGTRLSVPYFLALDVDHDLTLTPEYYSERGTGMQAEYAYAFWSDQRGRLRLWGISETQRRNFANENVGPEVNLAEEDRTPQRYWSTWGHNQGFGERIRATGSAEGASDGQVLREYEGVRDYRPAFSYQTGLTHQAGWGLTALTAEHASEYTEESLFADSDRFTDGRIRPMLLPRLSYSGGWQVAPRLPLRLELAGAVTRFLTEEGASGNAQMIEPAVTLPLRLGGSVELRPTVGRRVVRFAALEVDDAVLEQSPEERTDWLTDAEELGGEESFGQNELNVELRMPFARVFRPEGGNWEGLKHRVMPRLIYRELEDVAQPLGGLLLRPEPALKLLTLRLDNLLLGRRRLAKSRSELPMLQTAPGTAGNGAGMAAEPVPPPIALPRPIAELNLIQRYNLLLEDEEFEPVGPPLPSPGETEPGEPLLPAILEASYNGAGYSLDGFLRYHHQLDRLVEYQLGLTGTASPRGNFRIAYRENEAPYRTPENKLHSAGNNLSLAGRLIADDSLSFDAAGTVDLRNRDVPLDRRLTRASAAMDYHPNCYGIRVSYIESVDVAREFNPATGQNEDEFFIDRQILITFNLGGLVTTSRGFTVDTGEP